MTTMHQYAAYAEDGTILYATGETSEQALAAVVPGNTLWTYVPALNIKVRPTTPALAAAIAARGNLCVAACPLASGQLGTDAEAWQDTLRDLGSLAP